MLISTKIIPPVYSQVTAIEGSVMENLEDYIITSLQ